MTRWWLVEVEAAVVGDGREVVEGEPTCRGRGSRWCGSQGNHQRVVVTRWWSWRADGSRGNHQRVIMTRWWLLEMAPVGVGRGGRGGNGRWWSRGGGGGCWWSEVES
jgi:hypothetical protein